MKILAIETSCDDTCAAVLENDRIISNVISSQIDLHKKWGGVVPDLAKRAHEEKIKPVVEEALKRARVKMGEIEVIGVTYGPGLAIALGVGIAEAKRLAKKYKKKMVRVNHIEGHILSNLAKNSKGKPEREIEWPALVLTASGGHSKIVLMKEVGDYETVADTLDDAAGEALDKASKMLGLGYPGGAVMERLAEKGDENFLDLPRPMKGRKGFDFSFSGLKTSFYYKIKDWKKEKVAKNFANLAASFQRAVFDSLLNRFEKAIDYYKPKTLLASGGVLANELLRKDLRKLAKKKGVKIYLPWTKKLNTDNAGMIGVTTFYKAKRNEFVKNIEKLDREARAKL
jgi:N6-L-threonylcarbamoyladenine synthase